LGSIKSQDDDSISMQWGFCSSNEIASVVLKGVRVPVVLKGVRVRVDISLVVTIAWRCVCRH
jgi:hypothetical protein